MIGVDKIVLQQLAANAGISVETAAAIIAQKKAMVDPQQQMLAQALAALSVSNQNSAGVNVNSNGASSVDNNNNNNNNNTSQQRHSSRSLMENIELLNSKYMNQKQQSNQQTDNSAIINNQNQMNNYSNNNNNNNNNTNLNDYLINSTPNVSLNLKRQASASGFSSLSQAALFSTPIPAVSSPANAGLNSSSHASAFTNNRLNSTPNLQYGGGSNSNEQSR